VKALQQLELRIEVNEQTGLWTRFIADRETTPSIALYYGVGKVDVGRDRVHTQEEEAVGSEQRCRVLEIRRDIRIVAMLEDLDGDQIIEGRLTSLERAEVLTDETLRRQCRSSLDQTPQSFRGHIESDEIEASVQEWQIIATIAATDVET